MSTLARLKRRPSSWAAHSHPENQRERFLRLVGQSGDTEGMEAHARQLREWASRTHALLDEAKEPALLPVPARQGNEMGNLVTESVSQNL